MRTTLISAAAVVLAVAATGALAGDYEAGKKKVQEICQACHGEDGVKTVTPETPKLAGQHYDYLVHALELYKSGKRQNPLMSPMAQPLTKADMENVATYFSSQKGLQTEW